MQPEEWILLDTQAPWHSLSSPGPSSFILWTHLLTSPYCIEQVIPPGPLREAFSKLSCALPTKGVLPGPQGDMTLFPQVTHPDRQGLPETCSGCCSWHVWKTTSQHGPPYARIPSLWIDSQVFAHSDSQMNASQWADWSSQKLTLSATRLLFLWFLGPQRPIVTDYKGALHKSWKMVFTSEKYDLLYEFIFLPSFLFKEEHK